MIRALRHTRGRFGKIAFELMAVKELVPDHEGQLLNRVHATGMRLGLLVNFGSYPSDLVEPRILSEKL
jgi:GxxExxY protein